MGGGWCVVVSNQLPWTTLGVVQNQIIKRKLWNSMNEIVLVKEHCIFCGRNFKWWCRHWLQCNDINAILNTCEDLAFSILAGCQKTPTTSSSSVASLNEVCKDETFPDVSGYQHSSKICLIFHDIKASALQYIYLSSGLNLPWIMSSVSAQFTWVIFRTNPSTEITHNKANVCKRFIKKERFLPFRVQNWLNKDYNLDHLCAYV